MIVRVWHYDDGDDYFETTLTTLEEFVVKYREVDALPGPEQDPMTERQILLSERQDWFDAELKKRGITRLKQHWDVKVYGQRLDSLYTENRLQKHIDSIDPEGIELEKRIAAFTKTTGAN